MAKNLKAVVSGASKGIGKAIADKLMAKGFDVAISARNETDLQNLKVTLEEKHPESQLFVLSADMSERSEVLRFGEWAKEQLGEIDVLVNNAGFFLPGLITEEEFGTLEQQINTNLYSAYYLTRALIEAMKAKKSGHVFNICSIASLMAYPNGGSYSISKFAMLGFSKVLREEMKPHGIRVTSVMPGAVLTASWAAYDGPEERLMKAEDVADLIWSIYSLSDRTVVEDVVLRPQLGDL